LKHTRDRVTLVRVMAEYRVLAEDGREALWVYSERPTLYWTPLAAALFVSSWLTPSVFVSGLSLGVGAAWVYFWVQAALRYRRGFAARASSYREPIRVTVSAESIAIEHEHGALRFQVSALGRVLHLRKTVVVESAKPSQQLLVLPKKHLSEAELRTIGAWPVAQVRDQ